MDALLVIASTPDLRRGSTLHSAPVQVQDTSFLGRSVSTTVSLRLKIDSATPSITGETKQKQTTKKGKSRLEGGGCCFFVCFFRIASK